MGENYNNLTYNDRIRIETLHNAGHSMREIAMQLDVDYATIWREINERGAYVHRNPDWTEENRYSCDLAQDRADKNKKQLGKGLKVTNDMEFVKYVEKAILVYKLSPEAIIFNLEKEGWPYKTKICLSTLYNYIRSGVFLNVTMKDLPLPRKKKKKAIKFKRQKRISKGTSIEERPEHINNREEVGHWEGDTVIGSRGDSKECLLVLTERATNIEVIEPLKSRTAKEVVKALDRLEREIGEKNFRNTFKTITFDNGVEFSDVHNIERSRRNKKNRTKAFFCHAYSSWERGANENQNKFIRRFYPKGTEIKNLTRKKVKELQYWINTYPRHQFRGNSSLDMFGYLLNKNLEGF